MNDVIPVFCGDYTPTLKTKTISYKSLKNLLAYKGLVHIRLEPMKVELVIKSLGKNLL